jgi:hypothetical protein
MASKWEYKLEALNLADPPANLLHELNELGSQGWELITLLMKKKISVGESWTVAVFKRST